MPTIFYLHFNEPEIRERIRPLVEKGFDVRFHWSTTEAAKWKDYTPDLVILPLDRLPSHSRQYAEWIREAKKRQHIPIIFVGGEKEKVAPIRQRFPRAHFCSQAQLMKAVMQLTAPKGK